jgi:hypothetical protein
MPPAGFEPAIPASEQLQAHPLDRAANEIGLKMKVFSSFSCLASFMTS